MSIKRKKLKNFFLILITLVLLIFIYIFDYYYFSNKNLEIINTQTQLNKDKTLNISIKFKKNKFDLTYNYCYISNKDIKNFENIKWIKIKNNTCNVKKINDINNSKLYIKHGIKNKKPIKLENYIEDQVIDIIYKTKNDTLYLIPGEKYTINYDILSIKNTIKEYDLGFKSNNDNVKLENNIIIAEKVGESIVTTSNELFKKEYKIVVTDLIKKKEWNRNKSFLPCNKYSKEQAELIDKILEYKINEAGGYQTRGAVVAAIRFLLLEFPYKINYFPENGRLNNINYIPYVDGEGRYYHKGLYLNEYKFNEIKANSSGPAIWGCPLKVMLGEDDQPAGSYYPNGLDCSGFVAWALYNGGYDFGDMGAGFNNISAMSNISERKNITMSLLKSGTIKPGDIIGRDGHVAIIIGIDNNNVYVAETLFYNTGTTILTFSYNSLTYTDYFTYIMPMDSVYKNEGIYTNMW